MRRMLGFVAIASAGCSAILGIHDPEIVVAEEAGVVVVDSGPVDAGIDAAIAPTAMVIVPRVDAGGTFAIDVTEVTQAQYADFLARGTAAVVQLPQCGTNASFRPAGGFAPTLAPDQPVGGVDWCDAYAYCQWVGKRLCGNMSGVPGALADTGNVAQSEWLAACSNDGANAYPYGAAERPSACNTPSTSAGAPVDVKAMTLCEGGFAGVFDLLGNVAEWVDLCDATGCATMGGSYSYPSNQPLDCRTAQGHARLETYADLGFRCCR